MNKKQTKELMILTEAVAGSAGLGKAGRVHHLATFDKLAWFMLSSFGQNVEKLHEVLTVWQRTTSLVGEAKRQAKNQLCSVVNLILDNEYKASLQETRQGEVKKIAIESVTPETEEITISKAFRRLRNKYSDDVLQACFSAVMAEEAEPKTKEEAKKKASEIIAEREAVGRDQFVQLTQNALASIG